MKKYFLCMVALLSLAIVACESDDTAPAPAVRPTFDLIDAQPDVTSAVVAANIESKGEVPISEVGFSYQEAGGEYVDVVCTNFKDGLARQTLTGLKPDTEYRWYCYAVLGGERFNASLSKTFRTLKEGEVPPAPTPQFGKPSASEVQATSASLACAYLYTGDAADIAEAGFGYKPAASAQTGYTMVEITPDDSSLSARLEELTPETAYEFYAYLVIDGKNYTSERVVFTTESGTVPPPENVYRTGWAELPVEEQNSDYYYAHHICPDFYVGSQKARNYTVCFSAEHHCPVWVAAPRHDCYNGSSGRSSYSRDPDIPSNLQYSSTDTGGGCNKGHMLGSAERTVTKATNKQVFYYSNIAPQFSSSFNTGGGAWNNLESFVDAQVCADTTYIVVGTYFEPFTDAYGKSCTSSKIDFGGRSDVSRPSMFYYLLLRTKNGNTKKSVMDCAASELKCAAFVLRHNMDKGHKPQAKDMMSVAEIERLTGFTFFANVPNAPKDTYNPSDWGL